MRWVWKGRRGSPPYRVQVLWLGQTLWGQVRRASRFEILDQKVKKKKRDISFFESTGGGLVIEETQKVAGPETHQATS